MSRISILLVLATILFSCSKTSDDKEPTNDQAHEVVFNVSTFDQEIVDLKSSQSLSGVVNYLHYFVFTTGGELIYRKEYKHTDNNFGTIKDKLTEGNYQIVFLGTHDAITDEDLDGNYFQTDKIQLQDTYYKSISVSIPNENLDQTIKLERIVGKIEVIFTDKIPAEVASMDYILMYIPHELDLLNGNFNGSEGHKKSNTISISDSDKEQANYQIDIYEVATETGYNCNLIINYYDNQGVILGSKKISSVGIYRNKITRLRGELFSDDSADGNTFSLEVDTDWTDVIEKTF